MPKATPEKIEQLRQVVTILAPGIIEIWKAIWSNDPEWLTNAIVNFVVDVDKEGLME